MAVKYPDNFLKGLGTYSNLSSRPKFDDKVTSLVTCSKLMETIMSTQENQTSTRAADLLKSTTVKALKDALAFAETTDLAKINNLVTLEQMLVDLNDSVSKTTYVAKQAVEDRERLTKLEQTQQPRHTTRNVDVLQQAAKDPAAVKPVTTTDPETPNADITK